MIHLFNSRVQVERLTTTNNNGRSQMLWVPLDAPLDYVACRLDLVFMRPGKDIPAPLEAGRAPDRIGIMFCAADLAIRAGDRIVTVPNDFGLEPVKGTFDLKVIPDIAQDYSGGHHIEVQVVETLNDLQNWQAP